jgi:hypothetical protein
MSQGEREISIDEYVPIESKGKSGSLQSSAGITQPSPINAQVPLSVSFHARDSKQADDKNIQPLVRGSRLLQDVERSLGDDFG